jgi:hypothetical protein
VDLGPKLDPEVTRDALNSEGFAKASNYCAKLGFAATERDALLRAGPMLQQVGTQQHCTT